MFDALSDRLNDVFDRLRRRGALSEDDVGAAMREIRVALLEADVALPVVRDFVDAVREKAIGQEVLRSVTPGQMVVKIVHDHLVEVLGGGEARRQGRRHRPERDAAGRRSCWSGCRARARRRPAPRSRCASRTASARRC